MDSGTAPSTTPAVPAGAGGYDMGARRFGPDLGSFLQQDQYAGALADLGLALDPLTQNRYALAGGNPISYVEWDGHIPTPDNPVSANPTLNVQLNTAPSPSSGAYAASREAGAGTATGAGSEAACENLGVCRLSLRSTPQSSQSFLQQPAHAPCGARDWAEGFHNSPLTLDFGSNCLIQMMASPAPGINITVPGTLNLSGGAGGSPGRPRRFSRAELEDAAAYLWVKAHILREMLKTEGAKARMTFSVIAAQKPEGTVVDVVSASGTRGLTRSQRGRLFPWEVEAPPLPKEASSHDAEVTALDYINKQGWKPLAGGVSRPICPWCENAIRDKGGELVRRRFYSSSWGYSEEAFIFPG